MMSQQIGIVTLSWIIIFLTLCLVVNRLWVRMYLRGGIFSPNRAANWSDALVVIAWIFNLFRCIGTTVMYAKDAMVVVATLDTTIPRNVERIMISEKILYTIAVIYYVSLYCVKGSILCFLLEITSPNLIHIRRAIWVGIGMSVVGLVATIFLYIFSCKPISWWWDYFSQVSCHTATITTTLAICYHVFTDLYVYTIPCFLVSKLKIISLSQRLATGAMFGLGFLVVCFSFPQMISAFVPALSHQYPWSLWACMHEQGLAVMVACLPASRASVQLWLKTRREGAERPVGRRFLRGEIATKEVAQTACQTQSDAKPKDYHSSEKGTSLSNISSHDTMAERNDRAV